MKHGNRKSVTARFQRFPITIPVSVIVKNARSRCTCFWFNLANVSASGVGLVYTGNGFIPFVVGDVLHLTVDLSSVVFTRPIHLTAIVRRRNESETAVGDRMVTEVFLGAEITDSEKLHQTVWLQGLAALGDPFKYDIMMPRKKLEA